MTHYVENVGKDDVIFIEVLQATHFSGMFASFPRDRQDLTVTRCLRRPVAWPDTASDRDGHSEFDELDRLAVQEG